MRFTRGKKVGGVLREIDSRFESRPRAQVLRRAPKGILDGGLHCVQAKRHVKFEANGVRQVVKK